MTHPPHYHNKLLPLDTPTTHYNCSLSGEIVCNDATTTVDNNCVMSAKSADIATIGAGAGAAVILIIVALIVGLVIVKRKGKEDKLSTDVKSNKTIEFSKTSRSPQESDKNTSSPDETLHYHVGQSSIIQSTDKMIENNLGNEDDTYMNLNSEKEEYKKMGVSSEVETKEEELYADISIVPDSKIQKKTENLNKQQSSFGEEDMTYSSLNYNHDIPIQNDHSTYTHLIKKTSSKSSNEQNSVQNDTVKKVENVYNDTKLAKKDLQVTGDNFGEENSMYATLNYVDDQSDETNESMYSQLSGATHKTKTKRDKQPSTIDDSSKHETKEEQIYADNTLIVTDNNVPNVQKVAASTKISSIKETDMTYASLDYNIEILEEDNYSGLSTHLTKSNKNSSKEDAAQRPAQNDTRNEDDVYADNTIFEDDRTTIGAMNNNHKGECQKYDIDEDIYAEVSFVGNRKHNSEEIVVVKALDEGQENKEQATYLQIQDVVDLNV